MPAPISLAITEEGITDFHMGEANLHRQLVRNATQSVALADSSKLGIRALNNVCSLAQISLVITDRNARKQAVAALKAAGANLVIAK